MNAKGKKIALGADHFGAGLKDTLREYLTGEGYDVTDFGGTASTPVDYPDVASEVAGHVAKGEFDRAVLVCGTGAGMAICANKVPGVRAVCVTDPYTAERARASNNAQVITFGALTVGPEAAKKLVDIWLQAEFQGGRSTRKVEKIRQMEEAFKARA